MRPLPVPVVDHHDGDRDGDKEDQEDDQPVSLPPVRVIFADHMKNVAPLLIKTTIISMKVIGNMVMKIMIMMMILINLHHGHNGFGDQKNNENNQI